MEILVYIDPNDKPTTRTGYIGEIKLKALKTGSATVSFESSEVTEEVNEEAFVETTSTALDVTVVSAAASAASVSDITASTSQTSTATATNTPTSLSSGTASSLTGVSTGPIGAIAGSLFGGAVMYFVIKKRGKKE
jgi:hypothetical protein